MECSLYHCSLHGLQLLSTRYQPAEQARLDLEATGGAADLAYLRHLERQKQDDVVRWARRLDELKLAQQRGWEAITSAVRHVMPAEARSLNPGPDQPPSWRASPTRLSVAGGALRPGSSGGVSAVPRTPITGRSCGASSPTLGTPSDHRPMTSPPGRGRGREPMNVNGRPASVQAARPTSQQAARPASQPFLFAVAPPQAQPGARLELHELSGRLVLQWQCFRGADKELKDLEYRIACVEAGPERPPSAASPSPATQYERLR